MPRRALVVLLAMATMAAAVGTPIADDVTGVDAEGKQALLDASLLQFLMYRFWEDTGQACSETLTEGARVSAKTLADRMGAPYRARVPLRDPWGNAFEVECDDGDLVVLSPGPNGSYEHEYSRGDEYRERHDPLSDDLLKVNETVVQGPIPLTQRIEQTMADLRSIGTAFEEYAIDHNAYPTPTGGLTPISLVADEISPIYIRTVPVTDGWGNEFLVWSTGARYLLLSRGADGVVDFDARRAMVGGLTTDLSGAVADPARDLVFVDGLFVQWWERPTGP